MKILVLNCGSSSLKYQLLDMVAIEVLAKGVVERIGTQRSRHKYMLGCREFELITEINNHAKAVSVVIEALVDHDNGVLDGLGQIKGVGHRIVHGGEKFASSVLLEPSVIKTLQEVSGLAPLHNPANITGIKACTALMPNIPQVGVFDTSFHQTIPPHAFTYGIPYELYEKYGIRKYGFHGTSHRYVSSRAVQIMGRTLDGEDTRIITCHLGNGASVAAIRGGKSIDTSMGFTPLDGLVMGTRSGSLDPAVVSFIMENEGFSAEKMNEYLNNSCGVLGISGVSSDFRDISEAVERGEDRAKLALDVFAYNVKKYIGAYAAVLEGVDAIVFTAGIGENSSAIRSAIIDGMGYLGAYIDQAKNHSCKSECDISAEQASCAVLVIPTNEELMIARDTLEIVRQLDK